MIANTPKATFMCHILAAGQWHYYRITATLIISVVAPDS